MAANELVPTDAEVFEKFPVRRKNLRLQRDLPNGRLYLSLDRAADEPRLPTFFPFETRKNKLGGGKGLKPGRPEDAENGEEAAKRPCLGLSWMYQGKEAGHLRPADQGVFVEGPGGFLGFERKKNAGLILRDERACLLDELNEGIDKDGQEWDKVEDRIETVEQYHEDKTDLGYEPLNTTSLAKTLSGNSRSKLERALAGRGAAFSLSPALNLPFKPSPLCEVSTIQRRKRVPSSPAAPLRRSTRLAAAVAKAEGPRRSQRIAGRAAS